MDLEEVDTRKEDSALMEFSLGKNTAFQGIIRPLNRSRLLPISTKFWTNEAGKCVRLSISDAGSLAVKSAVKS
jgi:hypothetical protein